jgi:hypothetical protein
MLRSGGIPDLDREKTVACRIERFDGAHADRKLASDKWIVWRSDCDHPRARRRRDAGIEVNSRALRRYSL